MKALFDQSPVFGTEIFHADEMTGDFTIETRSDVAPVIDNNKRLATAGDGYGPTRELRRIASIPLNVIALWKEKYGVDVFNRDHNDGVKRLLNDPDWRYLRTSPGRF